MWLRNKKTGRVCDAIVRERKNSDGTYSIIVCTIEKRRLGYILAEYYSLAKLYEEWEDYKQVEPIIKDEEARGIIRAFAKRCGIKRFVYRQSDWTLRGIGSDDTISFGRATVEFGLKDGEDYTTTELCGEEKE